jgi:hypothetical protein
MVQSIIQTVIEIVIYLIGIGMFTFFCAAIGGAFESNAHETDPYRRKSENSVFTGSEIGGIIGFIIGVSFAGYALFFV